MKRIFQWQRYLNWKNLSPQEKLTVKRLLFLPIIAYFIIIFINQNALTLIFLIIGYFAYKNFEKGKIHK